MNSKNPELEINEDGFEVSDYGIVITPDMSRDEQEYHRYCPDWTKNPTLLWYQKQLKPRRLELELNIYCKSHDKDIKTYESLLWRNKEITPLKYAVLQYRQIYHPIRLQKSQKVAVCMIRGWIRENIKTSSYPPDVVITIIKIYTLEADCHFRITYYNPDEVYVRQKYDDINEEFTDEEEEQEGYKLLKELNDKNE